MLVNKIVGKCPTTQQFTQHNPVARCVGCSVFTNFSFVVCHFAFFLHIIARIFSHQMLVGCTFPSSSVHKKQLKFQEKQNGRGQICVQATAGSYGKDMCGVWLLVWRFRFARCPVYLGTVNIPTIPLTRCVLPLHDSAPEGSFENETCTLTWEKRLEKAAAKKRQQLQMQLLDFPPQTWNISFLVAPCAARSDSTCHSAMLQLSFFRFKKKILDGSCHPEC